MEGVVREALDHCGDPHKKREARMHAMEVIQNSGRLYSASWSNKVHVMLKKYEYIKVNKVPRVVGNMGDYATLETFRSAHYLKKAMFLTPITYKGCRIEFVSKPKPKILDAAMARLSNPTGRHFFVFFSDDSCHSSRMDDGSVFINDLDISSCDASHKSGLFKASHYMMPANMNDAEMRAMAQCWLPFRLTNPEDAREYVEMAPLRARLYSGHGWTTWFNNVANLLIAMAIIDADAHSPTEIVEAAIKGPGYRITCVDRDSTDIRCTTFLKNSPVFNESGAHCVFAFGVWLRTMGGITNDLPGRGSIRSRAVAMTKAVFNGMYSKVHSPFFDALREFYELQAASEDTDSRTLLAIDAYVTRAMRYKRINADHQTFTDAQLFRRYDLSHDEMEELRVCMVNTGFGQMFSCPAADKILKIDYGLSTRATTVLTRSKCVTFAERR